MLFAGIWLLLGFLMGIKHVYIDKDIGSFLRKFYEELQKELEEEIEDEEIEFSFELENRGNVIIIYTLSGFIGLLYDMRSTFAEMKNK